MLGTGPDGHKGRVQELRIGSSCSLLTVDPLLKLFHRNLYSLEFCTTRFTDSDATRLQEYISPGSGIKRVKFSSYNESVLGIVFSPSSLESLELFNFIDNSKTINCDLLSSNSNLKKLKIDCQEFHELMLFKQIASTLQKNTSLFHLLIQYGCERSFDQWSLSSIVLTVTELLQYNHTLQEITIYFRDCDHYNVREKSVEALVQLVQVAASNTSLKKLTCNSPLFQAVQSHIPRQHRYILYELDYSSPLFY